MSRFNFLWRVASVSAFTLAMGGCFGDCCGGKGEEEEEVETPTPTPSASASTIPCVCATCICPTPEAPDAGAPDASQPKTTQRRGGGGGWQQPGPSYPQSSPYPPSYPQNQGPVPYGVPVPVPYPVPGPSYTPCPTPGVLIGGVFHHAGNILHCIGSGFDGWGRPIPPVCQQIILPPQYVPCAPTYSGQNPSYFYDPIQPY